MLLGDSNSVSASTAGVITLYLSAVGNTLAARTFTTGFGNNSSSTTSVLETTYVIAGKGALA